jgi:organic hydroperoxide reductase OsmC/OhrA
MAAAQYGKSEMGEKAKVHAKVILGRPDTSVLPGIRSNKLGEGFGLGVELAVEGVEDDRIIRLAHQFCPYSRMLEHGGEVSVKKL